VPVGFLLQAAAGGSESSDDESGKSVESGSAGGRSGGSSCDEGNKEEEGGEEEDEPLSLKWPETRRKQATYLFLLPIVFPLWLTLPDVRNPVSGKKKMSPKKYS